MIPDEVRKAITAFENAVIRAWTLDTEDSFTDRDRKSTKEAYAQIIQRRDALIEAIEGAML